MAERTIHKGVQSGGRVYSPGQEDELNEVLTKDDVKYLTEKKAISGKWDGKAEPREPIRRGIQAISEKQPPQQSGSSEPAHADLRAVEAGKSTAPRSEGGGDGEAGAKKAGAKKAQGDDPKAGGEKKASAEEQQAAWENEHSLTKLPDHLKTIEDPAEVKKLAKADTRKGAVSIYDARLEELKGDEGASTTPEE